MKFAIEATNIYCLVLHMANESLLATKTPDNIFCEEFDVQNWTEGFMLISLIYQMPKIIFCHENSISLHNWRNSLLSRLSIMKF